MIMRHHRGTDDNNGEITAEHPKTLNFSSLYSHHRLSSRTHPCNRLYEIMITTRALLFAFTILLIVYENWVPIPHCDVVPSTDNGEVEHGDHTQVDDDLKVMMVADLLLSGSADGAGYLNVHFRDFHYSRFFKKSFEFLKPDMLIVLGDMSARGAELSRSKWSSVVQEFHRLLGPFLELPFHVVPGDRDIGECTRLNEISVDMISRSFPGLDSSGCGAFDIANVNFVSLNSVALLCGNNDLRFSVEKALEREHMELQTGSENMESAMNDSLGIEIPKYDIGWRENAMSSGSGPILLLHFPLHNMYGETVENMHGRAEMSKTRQLVRAGSYDLAQTLPLNATEYIFQALRPRMVFSAHAQKFSDRTHPDGTREVVVPAMSWDTGKNPSFVAVTFKRNGTVVIVSLCKLAGKSHVILFYLSFLFVLILTVQTTLRS